jgi:hypothetical protein
VALTRLEQGWETERFERPRAIHDQHTQSTYLFGAVCPERGTGAALVLPACNSEAMQLHLDEIATGTYFRRRKEFHGARTPFGASF